MKKLSNAQTKDRIAAALRHEILSGRIKDGEELAQEQLAEKLELSRMPVREALQMLEMEGLLKRLPNRHMRVIGLQENAVRECLRVLAVVEAEIALILAQSGKDISTLNPNAEKEFHYMLAELIDNSYLSQIHRRLLGGYPQYVWDNIAQRSNTMHAHEAILAAIRAANEPMIFDAVRKYYNDLADSLVTHMKEINSHEKPATH